MMRLMRRLPLLGCLLFAGCQLGPHHCVPDMEVEGEWHAAAEGVNEEAPLGLGELFNDPLLAEQLSLLISENNDVKLAGAKVRQAFASREVALAKLFPTLDGRVAFNQSKPAGGLLSGPDPVGNAFSDIPLDIKQLTFLADFDALWEVDLFGKRRKELEAATAFTQMEIASYQDLLVSLTAEYARTFLELRRNQNNLHLVEREIALLKEKSALISRRVEQGLDSELSLLENRLELNTLAAEAPFLKGEMERLLCRLSLLLGKKPDVLNGEFSASRQIPSVAEEIPVGFPSELLRRRPDIRYAERQLAKATAEVGVAVAGLFPSLTLTGSAGYQIIHLGQATGSGPSWGYGTNLIAPLFHAGSLRANLLRSRWARKGEMAAYEQVVLAALGETESAIAKFLQSKLSLEDNAAAWEAARGLLSRTEKLYNQGLADKLQLLDREQQAIEAERGWINAQVDNRNELIALYKALGGSWEGLCPSTPARGLGPLASPCS